MPPSPSNLPDFLTAAEAAQMMRLSDRSLERMRSEGRGPLYIRLGKGGRAKVLYRRDDVEEWLNGQRRR